MFYVNNPTMTAHRSGHAGIGITPVCSPSDLFNLFSDSQLNRLSDPYLGCVFNKTSRAKMAKQLYMEIENRLSDKSADSADDAIFERSAT